MTEAEFEKEVAKQTGMSLEALIDKRMREDSARAVIQTQVLNRINFEDNEIAKYYAEHSEDYMVPATYRIAEIVVRKDAGTPAQVREKIATCRRELEAGKDFAEVAATYSDSYSKENGGDLGLVEYGDLLDVIEAEVRTSEVGQISKTLETETSSFIIKVLEKNDAKPKPLEEVREDILAAMREPRMEAALKDFLESLRAEFVVETYVKVLPAYLQH
jgi:parvulin-like peptidyl-prolyl isomerase